MNFNLMYLLGYDIIISYKGNFVNKDIQTVFKYHEQTKHNFNKYAKSLGYMDWKNQPNSYRSYEDVKIIQLPLCFENITPPYHLIFNKVPSAPLQIESLSQYLQFSMGISAMKSDGYNSWALRCDASSGNLHPTEVYVVLPPMKGISQKTTICHYGVENHTLEILLESDTSWKGLPKESFFTLISSVIYREVWKYGERAFRYACLDSGHALRSLEISAKNLGWNYAINRKIDDEYLTKIFGFDKNDNFSEKELSEMLLFVSPKEIKNNDKFLEFYSTCNKKAKPITHVYQRWDLIDEIEEATKYKYFGNEKVTNFTEIERIPTKEAKEVILKRRSAQMMDRNNSAISKREFLTIIQSTNENFYTNHSYVNLSIFIHNVNEIEPGLYMYIRAKECKEKLQELLDIDFLWDEVEKDLYLLKTGDFRQIAKQISCSQDIASDGAFSLGMLCPFSEEIIKTSAHKYKELYFECGAIGQQLYLEATSLSLNATGIGCFLDDVFHQLLGLKSNQFQSLYHFTVGRAVIDNRILNIKIYENR